MVYNVFVRISLIISVLILSINTLFAAVNVIDVSINENVYQEVLYNPLKAGGGYWYDSNENQSVYNLSGSVVISNNHPTDAVNDIVINLTGISNIMNFSYGQGSIGYVLEENLTNDNILLLIPDLGPGQNSTFTYNINLSNRAPPLNFSTSYSDSRIFAGLPLTVNDMVENTLNSSEFPNNCIYNITIIQNALTANDSLLSNFTFDSSVRS